MVLDIRQGDAWTPVCTGGTDLLEFIEIIILIPKTSAISAVKNSYLAISSKKFRYPSTVIAGLKFLMTCAACPASP
jgi:hypothetical protein